MRDRFGLGRPSGHAYQQEPAHTRRATRRGPITVLLAASLVQLTGAATNHVDPLDGRDTNQRDSLRPKITATFPQESYRPGQRARLFVYSRAKQVTVQVFRAGLETTKTTANDRMLGAPVTGQIRIGAVRPGRVIRVRIGNWASGVYFAQLTAPGGRLGFAPFVLRPRRLGEHRVAVVMPTQTWQAYNFRDDDGDGDEDSWYAAGQHRAARRPFLNRGVPYTTSGTTRPFLKWLAQTGRSADYLADADLRRVSAARQLRAAYALIIFPGHHEYVTQHEYDVTLASVTAAGT